MATTKLTKANLSDILNSLSYAEFKELVEEYSDRTKSSFDKEMRKLITLDHQLHLERLGINSVCPACGSANVVKNGKRSTGVQKYRCKDCEHEYSLFSGTMLEKTRWHWDIWVKVLETLLNNISIQSTVNILKKDYGCDEIDPKTVWLWRLKLMHAMASVPMPKLTGVIQVDETFVRESQKGSRNLASTLKGEIRTPRYGLSPSKLGVMGPEFATIITAIDNRGYCVCKVSGLGKMTTEQFIELFEEHFENPSFLCSDGNSTYEEYSSLFNIPHYIKPSTYEEILKRYGYEKPDPANPKKAAETAAKNKRILKSLYEDGAIERIVNRGELSYAEFCALKKSNGLSLARVNELHKDLKDVIYKDKTNVSTKYLQDYVGFFTFVKNWAVDHGGRPTSFKDAEMIFEDLLKLKVNYTTLDAENQTVDLPKTTGKYVSILKAETKAARIATENRFFKFNEEDGFKTFNKREYLLSIPKTKVYEICKECGIKGYRKLSNWSVISMLLKHPDINAIIYRLLESDGKNRISDEDLAYIKAGHFKIKAKAPTE